MTSRALLIAACAVGLVHAGFSILWASGGTWLVETVGQWAVDWAHEEPRAAAVLLTGVALVKAAGAVVPLLVEEGRLPGRSGWRAIAWTGAAVLLVYGLLNTVGAWLVLGGLVDGAGDDRPALLGHALLWDPLFALWGGLLGAGLWASRQVPRVTSTR